MLDLPGKDDFQRNHPDTFIIWDESNIKNSNSEFYGIIDLPTAKPGQDSPDMGFDWLQSNLFPAYIRFEPDEEGDNWNIESVYLATTRHLDTFDQVTNHAFENPTEDHIWLGKNSGLILALLNA